VFHARGDKRGWENPAGEVVFGHVPAISFPLGRRASSSHVAQSSEFPEVDSGFWGIESASASINFGAADAAGQIGNLGGPAVSVVGRRAAGVDLSCVRGSASAESRQQLADFEEVYSGMLEA
jgi:hypothetical protein